MRTVAEPGGSQNGGGGDDGGGGGDLKATDEDAPLPLELESPQSRHSAERPKNSTK